MFEIKAPFNFVPLSDKVFYPDWADCISQDIPFEDSVSGSITLKITAKSPIFVRNGHTKADAEDGNSEYKSFSNDNGKFFIPGTSIKGAIRSVLETMSFGKMKTQEKYKFSQRDMNNDSVATNAGWLYCKNNRYFVKDCGEFLRIGHDELDSFLGMDLFGQNYNIDKADKTEFNRSRKDKDGRDLGMKTAYYKYVELLEKNGITRDRLYNLHFSRKGKSKRVKYDPNGNIIGSIVLTGQPNLWKYPRPKKGEGRGIGKFYEFIFRVDENECERELPKEVFDELDYAYRKSMDWAFLKQDIAKHGIPVFFNEDNPFEIGLTSLIKTRSKKSPEDLIPESHKRMDYDLAECMFGCISEDASLKGRVQFGHAFCSTKACSQEKDGYVLATPHASFYPLYAKGGTWNNAKGIAGRKRYIVRDSEYGVRESVGSDSMKSSASVLNAGTEFDEVISFHNLKKVELGALLSALTFNGNPSCRHSIGQGKPFGWGNSQINILALNVNGEWLYDYRQYMSEFEKTMDGYLGCSWVENPCIKELFAMSTPVPERANSLFSYMSLENKEFESAKKMGNLHQFSAIASEKNLCTNSARAIASIPAEEAENNRSQMETYMAERQAKEAERKAKDAEKQALREAIEQEQQAEKAKADAKLVSMDLAFLLTKTKFKGGKESLETKFKQAGLDMVCVETVNSIPEIAKQQIVDFVKLMFARPDKKWGAKNGDMAKDAAKAIVETWLGPDFHV